MPENKLVAVKPGLVANEPVRMCVICRRRFPKAALNRHVLSLQGNMTLDPEKTRPGRGWYLCSDPVCALKFAKYRPGARRAAAVMRGTSIALAVAAQPLIDKDSSATDADSSDAAAVMRGTRIALAAAARPLADKSSRDTDGDSLDKGGKHA